MLKLQRFLTKNNVNVLKCYKFSTKTIKVELEAERNELAGIFPDKFFKKKLKTPPHMYVANEKAAEIIDKHIEPFLKQTQCNTALEFNPGAGYFTERLLQRKQRFQNIILIENNDHFMPRLRELKTQHEPHIKLKHGDFVGLWKLVYQDKIDNGSRIEHLLEDVPKREHNAETNMLIFGTAGCYNFIKHLINSLVFQTSISTYGRYEMFLIMPPPIYIHLTCNNEVGYMLYRSTSILFQIFFEYRFIAQIPRNYFLPKQTEYAAVKGARMHHIKSLNSEHLYLIRIVPRRNIFDMISAVDLPALWYFIKQNCISRRNRVIPNLEKWIPGCGPRLIINTESSQTVQQLYADEDLTNLPKYSVPCTTINCHNYFPHMNIFTQFGDLSPSQLISLFVQFRQWPEYNESSFLASLESSLLKMETSADESVDHIAEEDDVGSEPASIDVTANDGTKKTTSRKKKIVN